MGVTKFSELCYPIQYKFWQIWRQLNTAKSLCLIFEGKIRIQALGVTLQEFGHVDTPKFVQLKFNSVFDSSQRFYYLFWTQINLNQVHVSRVNGFQSALYSSKLQVHLIFSLLEFILSHLP